MRIVVSLDTYCHLVVVCKYGVVPDFCIVVVGIVAVSCCCVLRRRLALVACFLSEKVKNKKIKKIVGSSASDSSLAL